MNLLGPRIAMDSLGAETLGFSHQFCCDMRIRHGGDATEVMLEEML